MTIKIINKIHYIKIILIAIYFTICAFTQKNAFAEDRNIIYVYSDEGVSDESLTHTMSTFKTILRKYDVKTIDAQQVKNGLWSKNAALFVMPGGADSPYAKKLNGYGNNIIKKYVMDGGAFLGICAGAYYGSSYVEFDKNGSLEILGNRELVFFRGKSIGPVLAPYDYKTQSGSRAAKIHVILDNPLDVLVFYNGGGFFEDAEQYSNTKVIGIYENNLPAIILVHYGKGRVLLSGVHFEYDPFLLSDNDQHIKKIIDPLNKYNDSRKELFNYLMKIIGIVQ